MSWKDKLQPASFRGVAFVVEDDDSTFGRRTQQFEYPQRDKPYVEDLGRRAREGSVIGYLIGPDYMAARDQLLAAIETAGPGELVHPWYGRIKVTLTDGCRISHSIREGGMCRVQLSFVEAGELSFPTSASAPGAQSLLAADAVQTSAITDFTDSFSVAGLPAFGVDDAVLAGSGILDTLDSILTSVGGVLSSPISILNDDLGGLVSDPLQLANRVFGLFAKGEAIYQTVGGYSDLDSLNFLRTFSTLRAVSQFAASTASGITPTRQRMVDNRAALNTLTRKALLSQAAGMTAVMALPVYDDAVKLRSELLTALDTEAAQADDDTYLALVDLRAKVHVDMDSKIRNAARLIEVQPREVQPALVVAYDIYESVEREGEIVARNGLRHPGFVPAKPLKVLSV